LGWVSLALDPPYDGYALQRMPVTLYVQQWVDSSHRKIVGPCWAE
jgi:hypothetical protein